MAKIPYQRVLLGAGLVLIAAGVALGIVAATVQRDGTVTLTSPFDDDRSPDDSPTRNIVVRTKHSKQIDVTNSEPVRLALLINPQSGASSEAGERVIELPEGYTLTSASAQLVGAAFEVVDATDRVQTPGGGESIEWVWNLTPTKKGSQTANINVRLELAAADGTTDSRQWTDDVDIKVTSAGRSFLDVIAQPISAGITLLLGSMLSIPFAYNVWRDRRAPRAGSR